jgi:ATP-binding cassette subfamily E protein 1
MTRIAIIDSNKCKPEKCSKECIKSCPPQKSGKQVIEIIDIENIVLNSNQNKSDIVRVDISKFNKLTDKKKIAKIAESLCIGCNQCVRVCPFEAIKIINLPEENPGDIIHRYNANGFRLYKLPILKPNTIIGIVGANGVGKTTLIEILSNKIRPNFEQFVKSFTDKEILAKFRGTVLQDYLKDLYGGKLKFSIKKQKIKEVIPPNSIIVKDFLQKNSINIDTLNPIPESFYSLEINKIINSSLQTLSGGELQRLLCWITAITPASVYIFDEPSNFLDVKQRLEISKLIRSINGENKYIIVIEHDLSILDYISDELYIVYGKAGAYGIVSKPLTTLEGINMYLAGYISIQNIRFRDEEFNLKPSNEIMSDLNQNLLSINDDNKHIYNVNIIKYPSHQIEFPGYKLSIPSGSITLSNSINVILGENGTGKTTFINWIAKSLGLSVSLKEQSINLKKFINKDGIYPTVLELLHHKIKSSYFNQTFQTDIIKQLDIEQLQTQRLDELSGGELQRVFIVLCLGIPADIYLFDEPSANLDIEKRLKVTKVIKKFIINNNKSAFIIEHDIMMSVAFAQEFGSKILLVKQDSYNDRIKNCSVSDQLDFSQGINRFLQLMKITMRISGHNRPRINKFNSQLDQEQKKSGKYYGLN